MADPAALAAAAVAPGREDDLANLGHQSLGEPPAKAARSGEQSAASIRHIQTEKRRRDRINDGYNLLRELVPSKDKADKATILLQVVEYIRQTQAVMAQVLAHAPNGQLPEELLWSLRVLLPREGFNPAGTAATSAVAQQHAAAAVPQATQAAQHAVSFAGQPQYTAQQLGMMPQGHSQGVEVYAPQGAGLPMDAHNQLQAFLAQVPPQTHMNQQQMMQLLQLQAMIQAQSNGQAVMAPGTQEALQQAAQQAQGMVEHTQQPGMAVPEDDDAAAAAAAVAAVAAEPQQAPPEAESMVPAEPQEQLPPMDHLEAVDPKEEELAAGEAAGEGGSEEGRATRRSSRRANQDATPGME
ncbi:hypothetical protein WJX73_002869 [Symbiochloris irregularis]|uniref:BHLH domain-containing protein n=1 Tax=Symbiochloris irregularis TaxID=706552 RepID=A0AAW1NW82_9CHLO